MCLRAAAIESLTGESGTTRIADAVVAKIAGMATREIHGVHSMGRGLARRVGQLRAKVPGQGESAGLHPGGSHDGPPGRLARESRRWGSRLASNEGDPMRALNRVLSLLLGLALPAVGCSPRSSPPWSRWATRRGSSPRMTGTRERDLATLPQMSRATVALIGEPDHFRVRLRVQVRPWTDLEALGHSLGHPTRTLRPNQRGLNPTASRPPSWSRPRRPLGVQ